MGYVLTGMGWERLCRTLSTGQKSEPRTTVGFECSTDASIPSMRAGTARRASLTIDSTERQIEGDGWSM